MAFSTFLIEIISLASNSEFYCMQTVACTLYCQKYSLTHPNNWNQVFQSLPWPQVYKSIKAPRHAECFYKHLWKNCCSQELSESQRGTLIGCRLPTSPVVKFSCSEVVLVSGIITKWKRLGTTATQPRSGRPGKMMERGHLMLRHIVRRCRQPSTIEVNRYTPPNFMWPSG